MTRGLRNNNPGNIRQSSVKYLGEIKPSRDRAFKQFESMEWGYRAIFVLLFTYHRNGYKTIRQIVTRYAPPIENHTDTYIKKVSEWTGIGPDIPLNPTNPTQMIPVVAAISRMENGRIANDAHVRDGWNLFTKHKP